MTLEQNISFIEILQHLPQLEALYEETDPMLDEFICMQYDDFDVRICETGNAYMIVVGSIKPVLIYDACKRTFDLSGVPISPIERILKKVSANV